MLHPLDSDHSVAVMTGCALVGALVCAGVFGVMMGPTAGLVGALVRGLRRRSARGDLSEERLGRAARMRRGLV